MPLGKARSSATERAEPSADQGDDSGGEVLTGHQVEPAAVDVGVAATVDGELVAASRLREAGQVRIGRQRPVGLPAQKPPIARRYDEQAPVGQPVHTQRKRWPSKDDVAVAVEVDGHHLLGAPIREPQAVLVPTWLLTEDQTGHQGFDLRHPCFSSIPRLL
jgi:hypothetical protein